MFIIKKLHDSCRLYLCVGRKSGGEKQCSRQSAALSEHVNPSLGAELACKAHVLCVQAVVEI